MKQANDQKKEMTNVKNVLDKSTNTNSIKTEIDSKLCRIIFLKGKLKGYIGI